MDELQLQILSQHILKLNWLIAEQAQGLAPSPTDSPLLKGLREIRNSLVVWYTNQGGTTWCGNA